MKSTEVLEKQLRNIMILIAIVLVVTVVNLTLTVISMGDAKNNTMQGEYDVSMFTEVTADELVESFKSTDIIVTYTGRETCGYCVAFLPVLQKAEEEYDIEMQYLDISKLDQAGAEKIQALDEFLEEYLGQTPLIIISKDGKLVDQFLGYDEYEAFAEFLETNGIKKR